LERRGAGGRVRAAPPGGRPAAAAARALIEDVAAGIASDGLELHPGGGYRHLLVWRGGEQGTETTPPHAIVGEPVAPALPRGPGAERLRAIMDPAGEVLRGPPPCENTPPRGGRAPHSVRLRGQAG